MCSSYNQLYVVGTVILLFLLFVDPGFAGAFPPGHGTPGMAPEPQMDRRRPLSPYEIWRDSREVEDLNLTKEQVAQLKEAEFAFRDNRLKLKAERCAVDLQMEKALFAQPVNRSAVLELAQKISRIDGEIFIQDIEAGLAFEALLTAKQLKMLKARALSCPP